MHVEQYYNVLNTLVGEYPALFGKTSYMMKYSVTPNPLKPNVEEMIRFSPLFGRFKEVKNLYEGEVFETLVEEFYVKSYLYSPIFLASFSTAGAPQTHLNGFVEEPRSVLLDIPVVDFVSNSGNDLLLFWAASHVGKMWRNNLHSAVKKYQQSGVKGLFFLEKLLLLGGNVDTNMVNINDVWLGTSTADGDSLRVCGNYWKWNDEYYYGDISETYRYLASPNFTLSNDLEEMYSFNTEAAHQSSFKNAMFSVNLVSLKPVIANVANSDTASQKCGMCGSAGSLSLHSFGTGVSVRMLTCETCFKEYEILTKNVINHTASHGLHLVNPYHLLMADRSHNVLSEGQLVSLALEYPEFKEEILESKNATDRVASAFVFSRRNK